MSTNKTLLKALEKNKDIVAKLIKTTMGENVKLDFLKTCFKYSNGLKAVDIYSSKVKLLEDSILKYRLENEKNIDLINRLIEMIVEVTESKIKIENISCTIAKINRKEQRATNKMSVDEFREINEAWLTQKAKEQTNARVNQKKIDEIIKELNIKDLKELAKNTIVAKLDLNSEAKETSVQYNRLMNLKEKYITQRNAKIKKRDIAIELEIKKANIDIYAFEQCLDDFIDQSIKYAAMNDNSNQNENAND